MPKAGLPVLIELPASVSERNLLKYPFRFSWYGKSALMFQEFT
jgi:hypothetical protein